MGGGERKVLYVKKFPIEGKMHEKIGQGKKGVILHCAGSAGRKRERLQRLRRERRQGRGRTLRLFRKRGGGGTITEKKKGRQRKRL